MDVAYRFEPRRDTQYLWASLRFTNRGEEGIQAEAPPSPWRFKAYATPDRRPPAIWEDRYRIPRGLALVIDLAPGQTRVHQVPPWRVADIMNGNPPGMYYLTVQLELIEPRGRTREYPAGAVDLQGPGGGG